MKKMSNIALAFIIITCIVLSSFIFYYSYSNIKRYSEKSTLYKNQNIRIKEKIEDSQNDLNELNAKINLIDKKLNTLNLKVEEYDKLKLINSKKDFEKYILETLNGNLDIDRRNSLKDKSSRYRKLRSTYFNEYEVSSKDEAITNMTINSILYNEYLYSNLNKEIVVNNNKIYKNIGVYNYYENTNNYFIKNEISKMINNGIYPVMEKDILNKDTELINLKYKNLIMLDTLLFPSENNFIYIKSVSDNIFHEKQSLGIENLKTIDLDNFDLNRKIDTVALFGIDVFSQNIDYERNYDIIDKTFELKDGVQVLRYLIDTRGRVYLIEERVNGEAKTLSYFDASGNPFVQFDIKNYKIHYFNKNDKNGLDKYNHSFELLKKYKRD